MDIRIGRHGWVQVGGDMNPGTYGGTIARADGRSIEIREIQPVREHVGDRDAAEIGYPFWTRDGYFDLSDLQPTARDVKSALASYGHDTDAAIAEALRDLKPESRAMYIAEALLRYGRGDEGPAGWAKDVVPGKVKWWGSKNPTGPSFLADEDREFRKLVRDRR